MSKINFDDYVENYEELLKNQLKFFASTHYFSEYKINLLARNVAHPPQTILEFGCGTGRNLFFLKKYFPSAKIFACDISKEALSFAAKQNPFAQFFMADQIPATLQVDLIFAAGVFHHITPEYYLFNLQNLHMMLNDSGEFFIFEHNPYNPITRYLVNTCEFDKDAQLINLNKMKTVLLNAKFITANAQYILFFPSCLSILRKIEQYLGWLPLGGQYFIQAKKS